MPTVTLLYVNLRLQTVKSYVSKKGRRQDENPALPRKRRMPYQLRHYKLLTTVCQSSYINGPPAEYFVIKLETFCD